MGYKDKVRITSCRNVYRNPLMDCWVEEDTRIGCECKEDFDPVNSKGEIQMKYAGTTRRIDELGRLVIPKEIQWALDVNEGDLIEIFMDGDGEVKLRKYRSKKKLVHRQYYRRG